MLCTKSRHTWGSARLLNMPKIVCLGADRQYTGGMAPAQQRTALLMLVKNLAVGMVAIKTGRRTQKNDGGDSQREQRNQGDKRSQGREEAGQDVGRVRSGLSLCDTPEIGPGVCGTDNLGSEHASTLAAEGCWNHHSSRLAPGEVFPILPRVPGQSQRCGAWRVPRMGELLCGTY